MLARSALVGIDGGWCRSSWAAAPFRPPGRSKWRRCQAGTTSTVGAHDRSCPKRIPSPHRPGEGWMAGIAELEKVQSELRGPRRLLADRITNQLQQVRFDMAGGPAVKAGY